jgi:CxxC-x17-CxxC domain-containing protein
MSHDRALEATCAECGRALSFHPWEGRPVRCEDCFDQHLRDVDNEFLASYGELGVASRRTVAETCLRALVLDNPPQRKVLALAIMEQFLLASSDLIGLYGALKRRAREPVIRSFLSFQLDRASADEFFDELLELPSDELLGGLGLPAAEVVSKRYPGLSPKDTKEVVLALNVAVRDLRNTAQRNSSAYLLAELAGQVRGGPALANQTSWLPQDGLRADQVASIVLDERRRRLVVQAVPVDEHRLAEVVDAIDTMTRAASNLIYAYLMVQDEEARVKALAEKV